MPHATVIQKVSHPPLSPKYRLFMPNILTSHRWVSSEQALGRLKASQVLVTFRALVLKEHKKCKGAIAQDHIRCNLLTYHIHLANLTAQSYNRITIARPCDPIDGAR